MTYPIDCQPKYRGKTAAGEIGENIKELDNNVGKILKTLEKLGIEVGC